jgi:hypothetical protein
MHGATIKIKNKNSKLCLKFPFGGHVLSKQESKCQNIHG